MEAGSIVRASRLQVCLYENEDHEFFVIFEPITTSPRDPALVSAPRQDLSEVLERDLIAFVVDMDRAREPARPRRPRPNLDQYDRRV